MARNGNYETSAVVKNQFTKQREQRSLGDCWQGKANGQCSKGDNCSFRHDTNERAISTQPNLSPGSSTQQNVKNASRTRSPTNRSPSGRMARLPCKDNLKGTCTNPFCEKWHPPECLFYKTENGYRFGEKCSYAHRQVDEQPSNRLKKNGGKSAVAMLKITRQLGCIFQEMEPPESSSILRKSSNILKPIRCVRFTKDGVRHANIRDQNPSLGMFCQVILISVTPMLQNLRIGLKKRHSGTSDVPVKQRGGWPKNILKLKEKTEQHSSHLRKIGACLHRQPFNLRNENLL